MAIAEAVNEREKDALRLSVKTCPKCKESFTEEELDTHLWVCPSCGAYIPMPARVRIDLLSDTDTFEELFGARLPRLSGKIHVRKSEKPGKRRRSLRCDQN